MPRYKNIWFCLVIVICAFLGCMAYMSYQVDMLSNRLHQYNIERATENQRYQDLISFNAFLEKKDQNKLFYTYYFSNGDNDILTKQLKKLKLKEHTYSYENPETLNNHLKSTRVEGQFFTSHHKHIQKFLNFIKNSHQIYILKHLEILNRDGAPDFQGGKKWQVSYVFNWVYADLNTMK